MPNWCNNTVEIYHQDPAMLERVRKGFNEGKLLNEFLPVPEDLQIVAGRVGDDNDPKQIELEALEKRNLEKYGARNWYDWCVANWGTKWDAKEIDFNDDGDQSAYVFFDTAWSPPIELFNWFARQYPDSEMQLEFIEEGCQFEGIWSYNPQDGFALNEWKPDPQTWE